MKLSVSLSIIIPVLLFFGVENGLAQRDTGKRFFMRNPFLVNPASAGYFDDFNITLVTDQTTGKLKSGNTRYITAVQYALNKSNLGFGGTMDYFKRGMFETIQIDVAMAYKLRINKDLLTAFGADVGLINNNYSVSGLNTQVNTLDPTLSSQYYSGSNLKIGLGASLVSYNLDIGLSIPKLFVSGEALNFLSTFYGSYAFELNGRNLMLRPGIYTNYFFGNLFNYEGSLNLLFQNAFWLQLGYGARNWAQGGFGFYHKQIEIGYNFEIVPNSSKVYLGSFHSILLSYYLKGNRSIAFLRPLRFKNYSK